MIEIGTSCLSVHRDVDKTLSRLSYKNKRKKGRKIDDSLIIYPRVGCIRIGEKKERERIKISLD